jgi:hypothetical protein
MYVTEAAGRVLAPNGYVSNVKSDRAEDQYVSNARTKRARTLSSKRLLTTVASAH